MSNFARNLIGWNSSHCTRLYIAQNLNFAFVPQRASAVIWSLITHFLSFYQALWQGQDWLPGSSGIQVVLAFPWIRSVHCGGRRGRSRVPRHPQDCGSQRVSWLVPSLSHFGFNARRLLLSYLVTHKGTSHRHKPKWLIGMRRLWCTATPSGLHASPLQVIPPPLPLLPPHHFVRLQWQFSSSSFKSFHLNSHTLGFFFQKTKTHNSF